MAVLQAVFNSYAWRPVSGGDLRYPAEKVMHCSSESVLPSQVSIPTSILLRADPAAQDRDGQGQLCREDYMRLVRDRGQAQRTSNLRIQPAHPF